MNGSLGDLKNIQTIGSISDFEEPVNNTNSLPLIYKTNEKNYMEEISKTSPNIQPKVSNIHSSMYIHIKKRFKNAEKPSMKRKWRTMVKKYKKLLINRKDLAEKAEPELSQLPQFSRYRVYVLICVMVIYFAAYLSYDSIPAQEDSIKKGMNINSQQLGLLYSFYNFPNTFMVLIGGILFDKLGVRKSTMIFISMMLMGTVLTALATGPWFKSYYLLLISRLIYGLGAESAYIALDSVVAIWWDGQNLAFAMGMQVAAGRLGDIAAFSGIPPTEEKIGYMRVLWICSCVTVLGFLAGIIFCLIDKRAEKYKKVLEHEFYQENNDISSFGGSVGINIYGEEDKALIINERVTYPKRSINDEDDEEEDEPEGVVSCSQFCSAIADSFKQMKNFSLCFWIVVMITTLYYSCIYSFLNFSQSLLSSYYGFSQTTAGNVTSIISGCALILSPVSGIILDKIGYRGYAVIMSSFGLTLSFMFLIMSTNQYLAYTAMAFIGIAFSLISAALWPCITFLVPEESYGLAFGIMGCGINTFGLILNYVLGILLEKNLITFSIMTWLVMAVISTLLSIWWNALDFKLGGDSQKASNEIEEEEEAEE